MKALAMFFPLFQRRSRALLVALLLSLITLCAGVALLGTSGWFITATALTTAGLGFNLFVPSAMVRGLSFVRILSRYGERLAGHDATLRLLSDLRGWLFARLFPRLPLPDRSLRHGDLVSRLTADVDALDTAFLVAVGPLLSAIMVGAAMTALLAWLLPAAALPYGVALAAALGVPAVMVTRSRPLGRDSVAAQAELRMSVLDGVHGHTDLVLLGRLGTTAQHFAAAGRVAARLRRRLGAASALGSFGVQVLAALALLGTLWAGLNALDSGQIEGPVLAGLMLAVLGSFEVTSIIVRSTAKASQAMAAAERLVALAELPIPLRDPAKPAVLPANGDIVLEGVRFAYPGLPIILDDLSLAITAGEHIAITGASGSGKSTLLNLLLRLAEPLSGRICIGAVPLPELALSELHAHMALLSQDSPIFIDTIRNNLLIGRAEASDDDLWAALALAQLDAHVRALPDGLDTILGEAGRSLSAGQARRLCLARALVSNAPVLLLDEPTHALDRDTEEAFFRVLATATKGRTVVLVTHAVLPAGTVDRTLTLRAGQLH